MKDILAIKRHLPFPNLGGEMGEEEIEAVTRILREVTADWRAGGFHREPETTEFEKAFAEYVGTRHAIAINANGTGLDIAMKMLDLQPGDEVITTPLTYCATAWAIIAAGGKPIFADIDPRTYNMDPAAAEARITSRTRAFFPIHNAGLSLDMEAFDALQEKYGLPVMIDAAHGIGGEYKGTKIGKRGALNVFSFQTGKNMTTLGEGGMITTDNDEYARRARRLRSFGWDNFDGEWDLAEPGFNYRMTKLQAAVGKIQLSRVDYIAERRAYLAGLLTDQLANVEELVPPYVPPEGYKHSFYTYCLLVPEKWRGEKRDELMKRLQADYGVGSAVHYLPLWHWKWMREHGYTNENCPVADSVCYCIFCPALHSQMTEDDIAYIAAALKAVVASLR